MKLKIEKAEIENLTICGECDGDFSMSNGTNPVKIDEQPLIYSALKEHIKAPEEIDDITKKLEIPSNLINYHLAVPTDLSFLKIPGISKSVHLPVIVSKREGGRESIYKLKTGETVLAGIFVNNDSVLLRYVKRESGYSDFAEIGDKYTTSLKDTKGNLVYQATGKLKSFDPKLGQGVIELKQTKNNQMAPSNVSASVTVSILWSCIYVNTNLQATDRFIS